MRCILSLASFLLLLNLEKQSSAYLLWFRKSSTEDNYSQVNPNRIEDIHRTNMLQNRTSPPYPISHNLMLIVHFLKIYISKPEAFVSQMTQKYL